MRTIEGQFTIHIVQNKNESGKFADAVHNDQLKIMITIDGLEAEAKLCSSSSSIKEKTVEFSYNYNF